MHQNWYEYPVQVQPHHTDYAGIVWHGSYIAWMEEARIAALGSVGIEFADLIALGYDLPVINLTLQYHRATPMGAIALVKTRLAAVNRVRLHWEYIIQSSNAQETYITGSVTLVPVDRKQGRIIRKLPPILKQALIKLAKNFNTNAVNPPP